MVVRLILSVILLSAHISLIAQEVTVQRGSVRNRPQQTTSGANTTVISERTRTQTIDLAQKTSSATWMRIVYRRIDLDKEQNAVLYYPVRPTEQRSNLFTQIFKLVNDNSLKVYEYLDGQEIFTDEYQVKFKDLLDRFRISYTERRGQDASRYQVALADIPSAEVKAYYIKETWFFNQTTSVYDVRIDAICPILYDMGDYGEVAMPLFWVPYENIRPYISSTPIMLSSINNAAYATLDDYFRLSLYHGDIVKTDNLRNLSLAQMVASPDSLISVQRRIELELDSFRKGLFASESLAPESVSAEVKASGNSRDKRVRSSSQKATKVKTPKASTPRSSGRSARSRG